MASLVSTRTLLIRVLYMNHKGLLDLLQEFAALDLTGSNTGNTGVKGNTTAATPGGVGTYGGGKADLINVLANFDQLIEVFEKQTRSAGVKACYDLDAIAKRGRFVFRASVRECDVLALELDGDGENEGRIEPMEYLIDMRNNLMMTDVPDEVEQELGVAHLVSTFVLQLRALAEIQDAIWTLIQDGHFGYQVGKIGNPETGFQRSFPFTADGLEALEVALKEYKEEINRFRQVVKQQRETHYFLNFFTMREIILLWDMLRSQDMSEFRFLTLTLTLTLTPTPTVTVTVTVTVTLTLTVTVTVTVSVILTLTLTLTLTLSLTLTVT